MFRLMIGFLAGLLVGRNCSRLALKGSRTLRKLADRLDRLAMEPEHLHGQTVEPENEMTIRSAA